MKVSVIIPNYNHAPYLKARIDSVLNQSYQDFEVIILDDKSTDDSVDVIESYRGNKRVSHIVLNEENSGSTFKQWQKGFSLARGEYIWIAESDDVAHPKFLEYLMRAIDGDEDVVMAVSRLQIINEKDEKGAVKGVSYIPGTYSDIPADKWDKCCNRWSGDEFVKNCLLMGNRLLNASSMIFKKSALKGLPLDYMDFKASGDYLFYIELAMRGRVVEVPMALDYFRRHSGTVSPKLTASGVQFKEDLKVFHRLQNLGMTSGRMINKVVGFRLWQIMHCDCFNSEDIRKEVESLWRNEVSCPGLSVMAYIWTGGMNNLRRRLYK